MCKTIMLQGTSSGAGKSTMSTALCRIFYEDGHNVAPFKAQNLSANSVLLPEGQEIAASQAIAALAAGINAHPDMNPVLIKPSKALGAEIILDGSSVGSIKSQAYDSLREKLRSHALSAFSRLAAKYEMIVAEGAGSPVEMNLRSGDFVNMGFAVATSTPVILVADIDRGGVFASVYGTVMLLEPEERSLVKGIIINKFRGDIESFNSGVDIIESLTGIPVLGVIPHIEIEIEDEDDLNSSSGSHKTVESIMRGKNKISYVDHLESEFKKLANHVRRYLDIEAIYKIMEV